MTNTTYPNCTNPYQGFEARIVLLIPLGKQLCTVSHVLSDVDNLLPPKGCDKIIRVPNKFNNINKDLCIRNAPLLKFYALAAIAQTN